MHPFKRINQTIVMLAVFLYMCTQSPNRMGCANLFNSNREIDYLFVYLNGSRCLSAVCVGTCACVTVGVRINQRVTNMTDC